MKHKTSKVICIKAYTSPAKAYKFRPLVVYNVFYPRNPNDIVILDCLDSKSGWRFFIDALNDEISHIRKERLFKDYFKDIE